MPSVAPTLVTYTSAAAVAVASDAWWHLLPICLLALRDTFSSTVREYERRR